jgi:chemotaxis protein MotB
VDEQPIIIKRKKKVVGGHHGGSWKVAFADFATAMMAFFLVLWLTSTASPEQKLAVEGYFRDPVGFTEGGTPNPVDLEGSASVINEATQDVEANQIQLQDEETH